MKNDRPIIAGQVRQRYLNFTKEFVILKECKHMCKIMYLECNTVVYKNKAYVQESVVVM